MGSDLCTGNTIQLKALEAMVLRELAAFKTNPERIIERFKADEPTPVKNGCTPSTRRLKQQLSELEKKRSRLIDLFADGMISKDELAVRSGRIDQDSADIAAKLDARVEPEKIDFEATARSIGSLSDLMKNLEIPQQKELLKTVMGDITVGKHHFEYSIYALPTSFVDWNCMSRGSWRQPA